MLFSEFVVLAQASDVDVAVTVGGSLFSLLCSLVIAVVVIAAQWKVFTKAGKPGWAAIIPIYNIIVLLDIVQKPWWWIFLFIIPFVNFVVLILIMLELAKAFGKGTGFALGLIFLSPIFMLILGFGDAQYQFGYSQQKYQF